MLGRYTTGPVERWRSIAEAVRPVVAGRRVAARIDIPMQSVARTDGRIGRGRRRALGATADREPDRPPPYTRAMSLIDLRSDTVTLPSPAMRRAMADAELGDDVFGDDPTVNALEERAAELLGKEAGLFVSSGTQGNLVSQMAHLARGQETIAGREHHLVIDEAAGHAVIVGASIRALDDRPDGTVDPERDRSLLP